MATVALAGGGAGAGAAAAAQGSRAGAADRAPFKIGYVCSCTGPDASSNALGPPAFKAWAATVNARGGIDGHPVQPIVKDDRENPGTSLSEVKSLVEQDHVLALVALSDVDTAWGSYAEAHHIPVLEANGSDTETLTNTYYFPGSQTIDSLPSAVVLAAQKTGAKKFGFFYCAESPACSETAGPLRAQAAKEGETLAYDTSISASAPNYTAQCLAAKQAGVEALYIADAVTVALSVAQSCVQQGYTPHFIAFDGAVSKAFRTAPGWNDGMISIQPVVPFAVQSTPGTKAMYKALRKYAPQALRSPNFNGLAVGGWVSGLLFEAAAKAGHLGAHGPATPAQLVDGLYDLHGTTLGGMAPPLSYVRGQPHSIDCWYWMGTAHQRFTTPGGTHPTCASASSSGHHQKSRHEHGARHGNRRH